MIQSLPKHQSGFMYKVIAFKLNKNVSFMEFEVAVRQLAEQLQVGVPIDVLAEAYAYAHDTSRVQPSWVFLTVHNLTWRIFIEEYFGK